MSINKIVKGAVSGLFVALILLIMLILIWCLPTNIIEKNYNKSLEVFEEEGNSWEPFFDYAWGGNLDNAMDYVILSTTVPRDDRGPIYNAVYCNDYARYWHGYLLYLRPLMLIFSYPQIRYIFLMIHILMLVIIFDLLRKRLGYSIAYGWIVTMVMMRINVLAFSIQFSSIFFVLYGIILYILLKYKKIDVGKTCVVLLMAGILTSYVDLLTAPLITLGIPLIFILCIHIRERATNMINIKTMILGSICWGIGYIGMWACKWPLMGIVLKQDVVGEITERIALRSGTQSFFVDGREVVPSFPRALIYNGYAFVPNIFGITSEFTRENVIRLIIIFVLLLCVFVGFGIKFYKNTALSRKTIVLPLVMVSMFPFIWFAFIKEHSCVHQFYTYRILSIFFLAIWCLVSIGISKDYFKSKKE